jgi:exodeoxyribonuclease VII large subunit
VIIVGRGGGSIEDLWAFNEESVAEAIFNSPIPIISAVGHETDTTIADYVADLRAPTPSAAAELAVFEYDRFQEKTEEYATVLMQMLQRQLQLKKDKAAAFGRELALLSPMSRVRDRQMRAANCEDRLNAAMQQVLQNFRHQLALDAERMKGLSPLERLSGGYAYAENEKGENIRSITQVTEGDVIRVRVSDGQIQTKVTGVTGEI